MICDALLCNMGVHSCTALNLSCLLVRLGYSLLVQRMALINGSGVDVLIVISLQAKAALILCKLIPRTDSTAASGLEGTISFLGLIRNPALKNTFSLASTARNGAIRAKAA
jgi:hypothetical protein